MDEMESHRVAVAKFMQRVSIYCSGGSRAIYGAPTSQGEYLKNFPNYPKSVMKNQETRMHSSRMRTARSSSRPRGGLPGSRPPHPRSRYPQPGRRHTPPVNRITDACENFTLRAVNIWSGGVLVFNVSLIIEV